MLKLATNSKQLHKAYSVLIAMIMLLASVAVTVDPELIKIIFSNEKMYTIAMSVLSAAVILTRYIKQFNLDDSLHTEKEIEAEVKDVE